MMAVLMMPNVVLQVAAIEAVTLVIDSKLIPGNDVVDLLLPSVLANINVVGTPDEVGCPAHWQQRLSLCLGQLGASMHSYDAVCRLSMRG